MVGKREITVAKGYRVADDIILPSGALAVLRHVHALASPRQGANVRLNHKRRAVVKLRRMGEVKS